MRINVIYASDTGCTNKAADMIAARLSGARAIDVTKATMADFENCDLLVLGSPTYGLGEVQDDWGRGLGLIEQAGLAGRKVALFGTGDQMSYSDTFVDAVGILYDAVTARGADVVGFTSTDGYSYENSKADRNGRFVGLVLDYDNQADKSDARIDAWVKTLR